VAYVADTGNHVIRRIDLDGTVTTLAGKAGEPGQADGTGSGARFKGPHAIAFGPDGMLYAADEYNTVRRITTAGEVTTFATSAGFTRLGVLAVASDGSVWATDRYATSAGGIKTALRRISPTGTVTTERWEFWPHSGILGMAFAPDGTLYLADSEYAQIYKIKPGVPDEVIHLKYADGGFTPQAVAIDAQGNVFLTESWDHSYSRIGHMAPDGQITIVGGAKNAGWKDGVGSKAVFSALTAIAVDNKGSLYLASANHVIRKGVVAGAPVINLHPQNVTTPAGGSVQFTVAASAEPAASYQWYRGDTAIAGATSANYSLSSVQAADAGNYSVKVSNSLGSVTSNPGVLTVSGGNPGPVGPGGGNAAGGGGAPSDWFLAALSLLSLARWCQQRRR
jgi:hypothetical protein